MNEQKKLMVVNRFQPMMIVSERRVECACGALAIWLLYSQDMPDTEPLPLCQECYERNVDESAGEL